MKVKTSKEFREIILKNISSIRDSRANIDQLITPGSLKSIRTRANLTLKELSSKVGVSSQYLCQIELNRQPLPIDILKAYIDLLKGSKDTWPLKISIPSTSRLKSRENTANIPKGKY